MIKIQNVTKKFGAQNALDNLTLEIEKGCAYGLLGSNGAGKSTLLRLLSGIYIQDNGRITIDDEPIYDNPALKEKIFFALIVIPPYGILSFFNYILTSY